MMDFGTAALLGFIQGLTEFIPVSSSGHLVLARPLLGIETTSLDLSFDAVLQLATALSLLVYFWRDSAGLIGRFIARTHSPEDKTLGMAIVAGTIPAVVFGLALEEYMDTVFRSATLVAWVLIGGSLLMAAAEYVGKGGAALSVKKGFVVGLFQSLALIPGVSRSGATISGGLLLGLSRVSAARFSFLLSIPIVLGSGLKKLLDLSGSGMLPSIGGELVLGFVAAFLSGLLAVHLLLSYLKNHTLYPFVAYRILLAVSILFFV